MFGINSIDGRVRRMGDRGLNNYYRIEEANFFYLSGYGSSNHGNGVALDLDLQDPGSDKGGKGYATTAEVRWLEKNAGRFGFKPYLAKPDKKKKD